MPPHLPRCSVVRSTSKVQPAGRDGGQPDATRRPDPDRQPSSGRARRPGRLVVIGACAAPAEARVTRIVVDEKRSPAYDGAVLRTRRHLRADQRPRLRRAGPPGSSQCGHHRPGPRPAQRPRHGRVRGDVHALAADGPGEGERRAHLRRAEPGQSAVLPRVPPRRRARRRLLLPSRRRHPDERLAGRRRRAGRRDDHRPGGEERATGPASPARSLARFVDMPAGTQTLALPSANAAGRSRYRAGDPHPPGRRGRRRHPDRRPATGRSPTAARPRSPARPTRRACR